MSESTLWNQQKQKAESAFEFWNIFFGLRQGNNNNENLGTVCKSKFICIIRAVSWVESKHGTAGINQPQRDPMQVGNPNDIAWKQFTGQISQGDRFIRGPGLSPNYWAEDLPDATKNEARFPNQAELSTLTNMNNGHNDTNFNAVMSYYWGIGFLIQKINTESSLGDDRRTYKSGDCSTQRMKKGAVAYNGGGDTQYENKIAEALDLINCM